MKWRNSLLILLLGLALGAVGKWSDCNSMLLADLTSGLQLWVLLCCALALGSRSPWRAGLHVFLLLGGMVCTYYLTAELMSVPWSESFLIGWGVVAALSPIPGFLVWYARGRSFRAWILCLGVLAFQILAMFVLSGHANLLDILLIAATAALLLWDKGPGRRTR